MNKAAAELRIAVVGLGFGSDFVPIYQRHPWVKSVVVCDKNETLLNSVCDRLGVSERLTDLNQVLTDESIDAVHLLTPVPLHVEQTLAVLASGKHCACAVPMATTIEDLHRIVRAQRAAKRNYIMMETGAFTREFFYVQDLHARELFGKLTFLRGTYFQDLDGDYPDYWKAQPPMHYITHAIGPLLALTGTRATRVCCFGSGQLRPDVQQPDGNHFPLQTAIFQLDGMDIAAEVTHSWFQVARSYTEAFCVYGDRRGFEWQQIEHEDPILFTLDEERPARRRDASFQRVKPPYRPDLLPAEISGFASGGHGGSHPHLVHEFISSIVEGRLPSIDAVTAADWCAPGICANESSLLNGEPVTIPSFTLRL